MSNSDQSEQTTPFNPDKFAEAAVSAAIEKFTNIKPVSEPTIPNNDKSVSTDETNSAKKELPVSVINESGSKVITTLSRKNNSETETPSSLPLTRDDNGNVDTLQTMALDQVTDNVTTLGESLAQNDALLGVTVPSNSVSSGPGLNLDISDNVTNEPMDVDINNEPNETLHGITLAGNVIMKPLHGVTDLNSLDHSYSRQTNDTLIVDPDYYGTTEDEDDTIEGLLQLSATDNHGDDFPGDNSQLLPIGVRIPDAAPTDITLETAAVTATIENIAL